MTELVIPPVAAKNQTPVGSSATAANGPLDSSTATSPEGDRAPMESFASVLRNQVERANKTDDATSEVNNVAANVASFFSRSDPLLIVSAPGVDPSVASPEADPVGITPIIDPLITAATDIPDAAAVLPLLAQLMAQSGNAAPKALSNESARTPITPGESSAAADNAGILASIGKSDTAAIVELPESLVIKPEPDAPSLDMAALKAPLRKENVPVAAISAEVDKPVDANIPSNTKPDADFATLLTRASNEHAAPTHAASAREVSTSMHMERPVGHPAWHNELADKMTWMATSQRQQADLVLNPPQLGRVEISLTITGDQASAVFASPNAAVREMLENSLPRLREILAGAGINLGEAQVGAESPGQSGQDQNGNRGSGGSRNQAFAATDALALAVPTAHWQSGTRSMVDIFA